MEKITMCVLYYFEDKTKKYYFETKTEAELARFSAYCGYDYLRLTQRGFVVPVTMVKKMFVPEYEIHKYQISHMDNELCNNNKIQTEQVK